MGGFGPPSFGELMPITRNGPVMNMDSNQPLRMLSSNQRFTRAQAHRLLKMNNIKHDHSASMEHLLYLIQMHNITPVFIEPGKLGGKDEQIPEVEKAPKPVKEVPKLALVEGSKASEEALPNNVPKLRRMCKDRKIMFKLTDKKIELMNKLRGHNVQNFA